MCITKTRNYRTLLDTSNMWERQAAKEAILDRLRYLQSMPGITNSAPGVNDGHVETGAAHVDGDQIGMP